MAEKALLEGGRGGEDGVGIGVLGPQVLEDGGVVAVGEPVPVVRPGVAVGQVGDAAPGRGRGERSVGKRHGGINYCATLPRPRTLAGLEGDR